MIPRLNQLSRDEAFALMPPAGAVKVIEQPARTGSEVKRHTWDGEYARARVARMAPFRTMDPRFDGFGLYFQDQDGNLFFVETVPPVVVAQAQP